jgi:hypothetical protein
MGAEIVRSGPDLFAGGGSRKRTKFFDPFIRSVFSLFPLAGSTVTTTTGRRIYFDFAPFCALHRRILRLGPWLIRQD